MLQAPTLVIGAECSGVGKTTTTLALLATLRSCGFKVACAKVGPDFIDATYLAKLSGLPCANLDLWLDGVSGVQNLWQRLKDLKPDIILIEGVMGLFDGGPSSTAAVASLFKAQVLLLLDAHGLSDSILAKALGYLSLGEKYSLNFAGILLTHVGSSLHAHLLHKALATLSVPLLGCLPKSSAPKLQFGTLGLASFEINADELSSNRLVPWFKANCQVDALLNRLNLQPKEHHKQEKDTSFFGVNHKCAKKTLAIAFDAAFYLCYADIPSYLSELGLEIVYFSPLNDQKIPECAGIYLPGGFPELYAKELSQNWQMRAALMALKEKGILIYAEGGGYSYLFTTLELGDGSKWPMADLLHGCVRKSPKRQALGYRELTLATPFVENIDTPLRGHEFHYYSLEAEYQPLWHVYDKDGQSQGQRGSVSQNIAGSFVHLTCQGGQKFWQGLANLMHGRM
ncbi:MAG: cobyrinate a,c-diamide synthase [Desulfovibrionaceae bacterium]|nr:cobyrinate a,c-diamide synthase [Desulfovibrionaceae bacterium]